MDRLNRIMRWIRIVPMAVAFLIAGPAPGQSYTAAPYPFGATKLPEAYFGHSPDALLYSLTAFLASVPKSDFETDAQYEARLAAMRGDIPTVGRLTATDVHAVTLAPADVFHAPDRGFLTVRLPTGRAASAGEHNLAGIVIRPGITLVMAEDAPVCCAARSAVEPDRLAALRSIDLRMDSEEARLAEKGLRLLVAFEPVAPFAAAGQAPQTGDYLFGRVLAVVAFNLFSGEVYDRLLTPSGEVRLTETPLRAGDRIGPFRVQLPTGALDANSRIEHGESASREYTVDATATQIRAYFRAELRREGWALQPGSFRELAFARGPDGLRLRARDGRFELVPMR